MSAPAAWLHAFDLRRATTVLPVPGGAAVRSPAFPAAHDHGKVSLLEDAAGVPEAAESALAGLRHRLVEVRTPSAPGVHRDLAEAGYRRDDVVLMLAGDVAPAPAPATVLTLAQRVQTAEDGWRGSLPDAAPDVWAQLAGRVATALPAADAVFLGVLEDGRVVARCDLFLHDGTAQVEEVVTDPQHRGRGHASLLVRDAVARARAAGAHTVFLVADADDWPRELYRRLGFTDLELLTSFSR